MGCLISLFFGGVIWFSVWLGNKRNQSQTKAAGAEPLAKSVFRVGVKTGVKTFQNDSLKVFEIRIRGAVNAPHDNYPVHNSVSAFDVTDGEDNPQPLLCMIEQLQLPETIVFGYTSPESRLPYANSLMSSWSEVLSVPVDAIVFPRKGLRKLEFSSAVISAIDGEQLASANCTTKYANPKVGYLELKTQRERSEVLAVQLAMAVSAVDGSLDEFEGKIVQDWIKKRIAAASEDDQPAVKTRLNKAVADVIERFKLGAAQQFMVKDDQGVEYGPIETETLRRWFEERRVVGETVLSNDGGELWSPLNAMPGLVALIQRGPSIEEICNEMKGVSSPAELYEALDLCLKVARADDIASDIELDLLADLAGKLGVDKNRFRKMTDKIIPVGMHEVVDADRLLGIEPDMTESQKKEHLRGEYKKWNARVIHSDANIRKQAEEMLDLIATTRDRLDH